MVVFASIVCTWFKSKFVLSPRRFSTVQWSRGHQNPLFRKQLMYFNVDITGCYFHICFILIANCDIKHISRSSHRLVWCSLKLFEKSFINSFKIAKFNLKFKETPMQIWKSANIFVFMWKKYFEDFTLKHLLLFEICALEVCEKYVHKHSERIEYVKN